MAQSNPSTRKLILFGLAVAIPLAAVAIYFAVFDQPPPVAQPSVAQAVPGGQTGPGQASLPADHPPVGAQTGDAQASAGAAAPAGHPQMGSGGRLIRLPDGVKGKWQAVKLRVEAKGGGKPPQVFTVKLGGELDIPASKLHIPGAQHFWRAQWNSVRPYFQRRALVS